jgi:hypothetical protein
VGVVHRGSSGFLQDPRTRIEPTAAQCNLLTMMDCTQGAQLWQDVRTWLLGGLLWRLDGHAAEEHGHEQTLTLQ